MCNCSKKLNEIANLVSDGISSITVVDSHYRYWVLAKGNRQVGYPVLSFSLQYPYTYNKLKSKVNQTFHVMEIYSFSNEAVEKRILENKLKSIDSERKLTLQKLKALK